MFPIVGSILGLVEERANMGAEGIGSKIAAKQESLKSSWLSTKALALKLKLVALTHDFRLAVRTTPASKVALPVIAAWLVIVVAAPIIAPYAPEIQNLDRRLEPPSLEHPFGTDQLGRDVLSRVMYGGRVSIPLGIALVAIACAIGTCVGAVAGYVGGMIDEGLMRLTDVVMSIPGILLAMSVAAALGPGLAHAMIAMVVVWWPRYARLMRGMVLSEAQRDYVLAAKAIGASDLRIVGFHIFPNAFPPVLIDATLGVGRGIMMGAWLGFLGLGVVPPTPEWGSMVDAGSAVFQQWWVCTFPALAILSIVLSLNIVGDTVRDALDPRTRSSVST